MSIGIILALIFIVACVAGVAVAVNAFAKKDRKKMTIGGIVSVIFGLMLVLIPMSFHTVQAGEIAVVKDLGKATNVRTAGTYFDFWITKKYDVYDAKVQNLEIAAQAYSKDAQTMSIAMTV